MNHQSSADIVSKSWKEVGLKVGAWGLLLLVCLMVFMALPLLALSI